MQDKRGIRLYPQVDLHLNRWKPYLLTMRFFGLGTAAEKDTVLSELKAMLNEDDCMLKWMYYDLLLSENNNNTDAIVNLRRMVDEGYTNKFTKEKSHIEKVTTQSEVSVSQKNTTVNEPRSGIPVHTHQYQRSLTSRITFFIHQPMHG